MEVRWGELLTTSKNVEVTMVVSDDNALIMPPKKLYTIRVLLAHPFLGANSQYYRRLAAVHPVITSSYLKTILSQVCPFLVTYRTSLI
jgi:hypothetical protein